MASPHYGEHFARHWLDVARYADSGGFANDYSRPNAWRYRDYVVSSFNKDKPYNHFVKEQLAGDEMDSDEGRKSGCNRIPSHGPMGTDGDECVQGDPSTLA